MDWKGLVGTVAPMLGTALGGPLGGLAVHAIGDALGLSQKTEDTVSAAIAGATPEQMIAIKNADADFRLKMQQLGFEHEEKLAALNASAAELDVKDRQGARDLQSATKSLTVPVLAYTIVGSFIAMVAGSLLGYSHVDSALAGTLVGYLSAKCEQVIAYYFGSSHGSQAKDAMLYQSTPKQ
jgi:hypothetical protein